MHQRLADYRVFWRQFRQAYYSTGAVLPSGRNLSRALTRYVRTGEAASAAGRDTQAARHILEVGPGTGAVTVQIIQTMHPSDRLTLIERNEQFVAHLRERLNEIPGIESCRDRVSLVHSAIEQLPEDRPYDLIISGLPLNNFPVASVEQILAKLRSLLAPEGILSFFEYAAIRRVKSLVSSRAERERLHGIAQVLRDFLRGTEIHRDLVLRNVPPAWVHHVRIEA
jgi:phospholipid N-methyltransferase